MRHGLIVLLSALVTAGGEPVSADETTKETLANIERELARASLHLDPAPYDRYWADDFVGIDPAGGTYTKAQHRAALTSGKLKFASLDIENIDVHLFGDTAVVTERRIVKGTFDNHDISARNNIMSVFVQRNGQWQKVAEHTARAPD